MNTQKKQGRRLNMEDLYHFIKINKNTFQNIGCINLNEVIERKEELTRLHFQDIRKIQTLPNFISEFLQVSDTTVQKYLHAGTFTHTKGSINLSLFSSIVSCLKRSFLSLTMISQEKFLLQFIDRFKNDLNSIFILHKYDKIYNWSRAELADDICYGIFSGKLLHVLCDYFCLNIFVLDVVDDIVYFGGGIHYVPYRRNIFLLKHANDVFEPVFTEQTRLFTLSDDVMKVIRKSIRKTTLYGVYGNGVTRPEEFEEDLTKYNPPPRKTKKQLNKELAEKTKKEESELALTSNKEDLRLSEYDETINGFSENASEQDNNTDQLIEVVDKKKTVKQSKKIEWIIQDSDDELEEVIKKPTKKVKTSVPTVNLAEVKTMKVPELQATATKLNIPIREGGKALTKAQLLFKIENFTNEFI